METIRQPGTENNSFFPQRSPASKAATAGGESPKDLSRVYAPADSRIQARRSCCAQIEDFFRAHPGERFASPALHARFGRSFRARVSEINRNPASPIRILNRTIVTKDALDRPCERSVYWAELRSDSQNPPQPGESAFARSRREELERFAPLFAGTTRT